MEKKRLLKGAEAVGEAAIQSGCNRFYGYPVPNQSDLLEYLVQEEKNGRGLTVFQSEDPLSSLFMAYGATLAGARVLTAVNSIDLPDALRAASYFSAANLPLVCVIFTQSGPGSGNIYPEQSSTLAALYGTRLGDGFAPIFTPSTPADCAASTHMAFKIAETYQVPVFILIDAACAQLVETVDFSDLSIKHVPMNRAGILENDTGDPTKVTTLALDIDEMAERKEGLMEKEARFLDKEKGSFKTAGEDDKIVITAYGIGAVQAKRTADALLSEGLSCTVFEPLSLYPFPEEPFAETLKKAKHLFIIDLSQGQFDKILNPFIPEKISTHVFTTTGGGVPRVEQLKLWIQGKLQQS